MSVFSSFAHANYPFKTIMVYGSDREGRYDKVIKAFQEDGYFVINMFQRCDTREAMLAPAKTSDGRDIQLINRDFLLDRCCKNWLSTVVAENIWRQKQGYPLIPIIFCIGHRMPDSSERILPIDGFASRETRSFTAREVRRAYKLCSDQSTQAVANETFKFVITVLSLGDQVTSLTEIPCPWKDPSWKDLWEIRMQTHQDDSSKYVRKNLASDDPDQPHFHSLRSRIMSWSA